jgi:hypothetical protein
VEACGAVLLILYILRRVGRAIWNAVKWVPLTFGVTRRFRRDQRTRLRHVNPSVLADIALPGAIDRRVDPEGPIFISYSRSESLLADEIVRRLEADGHRVFVDFRSLQPGESWMKQLDAAVVSSPVFVVIVSDRAVWQSENVQKEWLGALQRGQRIVLAIADPVPLPAALAGRPAVDLRIGRFDARLRELSERVAEQREGVARNEIPGPPGAMAATRPSVRRPRVLLFSALFAFPIAATSLVFGWYVFSWPTMGLHADVLRRKVQHSAVVGVCGTFVALFAIWGADLGWHPLWLAPAAYFAGFAVVITRRGVRRWLEPMTVRERPPLATGEVLPDVTRTEYWIEAAEEDREYAWVMVRALTGFGHTFKGFAVDSSKEYVGIGQDRTSLPEGARVLKFVSRFSATSELITGSRTTPILLSNVGRQLPPALSESQWLDLRSEWPQLGSQEMEVIARCLDSPEKLLRWLGTPPPHDQFVLPRPVRRLHDLCLVTVACLTLPALLATSFVRALPGLAAAAIGLLVIRTLRRRTPSRLFRLYLPSMIVLSTAYTVSNLHWSTAAIPIVLIVGWWLTRRPADQWVPNYAWTPPLGIEPGWDFSSFLVNAGYYLWNALRGFLLATYWEERQLRAGRSGYTASAAPDPR